jgi:hypothetical protein
MFRALSDSIQCHMSFSVTRGLRTPLTCLMWHTISEISNIIIFPYCKPGNLKRFTYNKLSTNFERCSNQFPDMVRNVARSREN